MNRTYFVWYESDVNVALILIATVLINQRIHSEYE